MLTFFLLTYQSLCCWHIISNENWRCQDAVLVFPQSGALSFTSRRIGRDVTLRTNTWAHCLLHGNKDCVESSLKGRLSFKQKSRALVVLLSLSTRSVSTIKTPLLTLGFQIPLSWTPTCLHIGTQSSNTINPLKYQRGRWDVHRSVMNSFCWRSLMKVTHEGHSRCVSPTTQNLPDSHHFHHKWLWNN